MAWNFSAAWRPTQAVIRLARRRTNVLYALLRDNRTWQPDSPEISPKAALLPRVKMPACLI